MAAWEYCTDILFLGELPKDHLTLEAISPSLFWDKGLTGIVL